MSNGVIAVVGAGPGIGLAVARRFAREDYRVALLSRSANNLVGELHELEEALGFPMDASDSESIKNAFNNIAHQLSVPTVLVYNVARMAEVFPSELTEEQMFEDFRINVSGAVVAAQQVIPTMKERGQGTILFTGGGLSLYPSARYASLALGKAALRNLAGSFADELTDHGIKVGTVTVAGFVQPGTPFDPDLIAERFWQLHQAPPSKQDYEIVFTGAAVG